MPRTPARSILFVSPQPERFNYYAIDVMAARGYRPATMFGDVSIVTLAAMAAPTLDVAVCDQAIDAVDFDSDVDLVGITGKITQFENMVRVAEGFRRRGKTVLIGGPLATLSPERVRPHCDILVRGEIEDLAAELFADLRQGTAKDEYQGGLPSLEQPLVPRWDLYNNRRALGASVQTGRGCPYDCDFCDVVRYNGRRQRFKPITAVLAELDEVYRHGHRFVLFADDNLTVARPRAKELLLAVRDWNRRQQRGHVRFATQCSIDIAHDDELLALAAEAGLVVLFIGVESPNTEGLRQAGKLHNLKAPLEGDLAKIMSYGIMVTGGMIVGFDADGHDIFERQLAFAQHSGVPIFSCGALMAPDGTPLQKRLAAAGRLRHDGLGASGNPFTTNIVHPTLDHDALLSGLRTLVCALYSEHHFGERLERFIALLGPRRDPDAKNPGRFIDLPRVTREAIQMVGQCGKDSPAQQALLARAQALAEARPDCAVFVYEAMVGYLQVRHMLAAHDSQTISK